MPPVLCDELDAVWASESPVAPSEPSALTEQEFFLRDSIESPQFAAESVSCNSKGAGPNIDDSSESPSVLCPRIGFLTVEIPECVLLTPRSCYEPFDAGVPTLSEPEALATLAMVRKRLRKPAAGFIEYDLDEFAVYCDTHAYPCEMRSLHHLDTRMGLGLFFFNGILSVGGENKVFVKRVPIMAMPIDNYGDLSKHTVRGCIWLQSELNCQRDIYYKLGKPAKEYARFFKPLLWVADLAKHFVDFLKVLEDHKRQVSIHLFRTTFSTWLQRKHKEAPAFIEWLGQHPNSDFRASILANISFLHKEAIGVLGEKSTYYHPIWSEVWDFSRYKKQPRATNPQTVVTQYMYDCFEHMPFGDQLTVVPMSTKTGLLHKRLIRERHLEQPSALHNTAQSVSTAPKERIKNIRPGDTISTHRDGEQSGTAWKREVSRGFGDVDRWFALVLKTHTKRNGTRVFDVIWYYRPVDTLCGLMKYPWNNELFLSDHCSCEEACKISEDQVLGVHDVDFGGSSTTSSEFFCRQTYILEERKWITVDAKHMQCEHMGNRSRASQYKPGDTLLIHLDTASSTSEPCEVISSFVEEGKKTYQLRRLLRRREVDPQATAARLNELVYSEILCKAKEDRIISRCHVRVYPTDTDIPKPYDRDGVGCYFYITHREFADQDGVRRCVPLEAVPTTIRQGPDPGLEVPRLRGFDLFCGGGNFGRGLEDGGGIEMNWANDYDSKAIHTYMANVEPAKSVAPFLGSIDDLQRLAIEGKFSDAVPAIGAVDFVSGGSPCPGFSHLTNDKTTGKQRKNQSLVAAFGSFIDLYRPKYGLLENVPGIVHKRANRDQDVFSQLICAIVGLGYQTQFFFLDASSYGSSQRRSRVFLAFAAPGYKLPAKPPITHSHPPNTKSLGLGMLPTGEPMAEREMPKATPFKFVTAEEATSDLPALYDAKPDICVPFPDHRVSVGITRNLRLRISLIPTWPWGMNFAQAWYGSGPKRAPGAGILSPSERAFFTGADDGDSGPSALKQLPTRDTSNAYGRLVPQRPFETIVTAPNPGDGKNGRSLHWRENRIITIMEARRAQGIHDDEVLLGNSATQYRIVGNSVARQVAVALGVVFREAWVESLRESGELGDGQGARVEVGESDDGGEATMLAIDNSAIIVDDDVSASSGSLQDNSSRDGSTPMTTMTSIPASPSSGALAAVRNGRKRQNSLIVEVLAPKRWRSESPRGLVSRAGSTMAEPSPLGRTVVTGEPWESRALGE